MFSMMPMSDIYASTDSLHVLDLIGSDYTAFGIDCTAYLCNVSFRYVRVQVCYENTFDTSSVHRPAFSWDCDVPRLPFLGCDDYELYLAGLLHWPQDGVTVQVSLCLFGVNEFKVKQKRTDMISCLKEHKVLLCWTAVTQTPVLLLHEDPSLLVAAHRFHTEPHYTDRLRALVLREILKSICPPFSCYLLFPKMAGKSTEFSRTHILRDAPRFSG